MPPENLPESLLFHPKWWVDPIPWPLWQQLDKNILTQVAIAQLHLQKEVLSAQIKALDQITTILSKRG